MQGLPLLNNATIPPIGFGTWKMVFPGQAERAVLQALEFGYRMVDTARIYRNEGGVGKALAATPVKREDIFVTTKLWNADQGYESAHAAFRASKKRLRLDYLDLYLLHWPVSGKRLDSWRALEELYTSGETRAIGVSNFTVRHLEELIGHSKVVPAVNQIEFHPFLYEEQKPLLDFCHSHGIIVEAYSPLAHGERMDDPVITRIAANHAKSNAQVMLRWCIQKGTVPLPKASHADRIKENLDIFDFTLSPDEETAIDGLSDGTRTCWDPNSIL